MHADQITDTFECGQPEQVWTVTIAYLETRARQSEDIAESLRREAKDAIEQADGHFTAAQEFHNLALAMKRASVTFAASGMEARQGQDGETRLDAKHDSPAPSGDAKGPAA